MPIKPDKTSQNEATEGDFERQLREMNEELLVSAVRQHELVEKAEKAEESLRLSEEQFRLGILNSPIPVIMHAEDGEVLQLSRSWTDLTGYTREDAGIIQSWLTKAYGAGAEQVRDAMKRSFLPSENGEGPMLSRVFDITTRDGERRTWSFSASAPGMLDDGRRFVVGVAEDVTERKRAESLIECQKESLELLVRGEPLEQVLDFLARSMESLSGGRFLVALHLMEPDGYHFGHVAAPSLPASYAEATMGMDARLELGTCSSAVVRREPTIVRDFAAETRWPAFTEEVISLGLHACFTTPIVSPPDERVLGTFAIYYREPCDPSPGDRQLVDFVTQTVALAIDRKQGEDELKQQKRLLEALTESVLDGILIVSPDGQMLHHNQQFLDIWNFPSEVVESKSDEAALKWAAEQTTDPAAFLARVTDIYARPEGQFREEMPMKDGRVYERFGAPVQHGQTRLGWVWTFRDITERKRAEESIKESEQRMRVAMNAANMYSWEIDVETRETIISHETSQVLGFQRSTVPTRLEKVVESVIHPDDLEKVTAALESAFATGEYHQQMRFVAPETGEIVWVESQGVATRDETGKPVKLLGVTQNITERKRAEDALRENEYRLRTMADSIPQLAWMAEPDGFIFWYNRRWYEYTGTAPEEMEGWGWQSVHDPNILPNVLANWTKSIETGEPFEMEFPLRAADGAFRWFLTRVHPLRDAEERIVRWFGTNTDIEESRRIRDALRESEERFVKAFNSSPLSITITSLETGKLVEVNDTFVAVTGYGREEAVGRTTAELGLWEETADREAELETVAKIGSLRANEYRFRMKDGSQIVGLLSAEFIEIGGEKCALTVIQDITERHRADEALRKSEERFVRFMQYLPGLAWIKDIDGHYVYANDAAVEVFRTPREQLYGKTDDEIFPPEIAGQFRENDELALNGRTGVQTVEKLEHEDGRVHHSIVNKFPIMDADGRAALIGGMAIDITDRMRAEEALRESEETYRILAETASDAIIRIDENSIIQFVNTAVTRVFGYEPEELLRQSLTMLMPENLRAKHRAGFSRYLRTGKRKLNWASIEIPARHKDGRLFPLEISFGEYARDDKRFFIGIARDITERKEMEDARRESERRFHLLADNISQLAWMMDAEGYIFWYNQRWFEYTGTTPEEMQGWGWQKVHHPDEVDRVVKKFKRHIASGEVWEDTFPLRSKNGEYRWFLSRALPIRDSEGNILQWFGTNTDITSRREAEEALRESEERRHLAQNAGNVGIFDWDILADKTYWSETMWEFYGEKLRDVNPDETFWSDHIHGNDRDRVKDHIRSVVASGDDEFRDEYRIVHKDGSIRWIEAVARVLHDDTGRATRMYGVNLDITERREAEEKIRISENQLRLVTDTVPALISYIDSGLRYRYVNKKYTEWFRLGREDVIGQKVADVLGQQAFRAVKPSMEKALSGEQVTFEGSLNYKAAGRRFVRASYVPDFGLDGNVSGFYALVSDLTDLKLSKDLLRSSEDRIALMMESLVDYAIFSTDGEGRVESWNQGAENIYGYSRDEMLGHSSEILFTAEDVARGVPIREMRTARQKGQASGERWNVRKDGTRFFAAGTLMPLYVGESLTGYARIASDLTEKQRRADELQRAHDELEIRVVDRTKELAETNLVLMQEMEEREIAERQRVDLLRRLVSSQESERRRIARDLHDTLGQRLTALRLKIASLMDAAAGHKDFASRVQRLQEISERLDSEVSFLAWELRPSALDDLGLAAAVGAYVSEWSKHHEIAADFHSARFTHELPNSEIETHLYRITQEALNNIAKHSGARNVSVLLDRRDTDLILIIEDDGRGFNPEKVPPPAESGKGLGLLGMSERATLVGGDLEIESAPGKGTTIYARVPFFTG